LQVFDHPSIADISSYISTLRGAAASAAANVISDDGDESDDGFSLQEYQLATAASLRVARAPAIASSTLQTPLVGISGMASKTANNAVMHLPGVDASNRVPFNRWELEKQEQVSAGTWPHVGHRTCPHVRHRNSRAADCVAVVDSGNEFHNLSKSNSCVF
jgi:hypothetical protein